MRHLYRIAVLILLSCFAFACAPTPQSPKGFRLPDGDPQKGMDAFAELRCASCHQLKDSILPYTGANEPIVLGGKVTKVKTYGELVTSIIHPSHKIAPGSIEGVHNVGQESMMEYANLNQIMTVQELIDLVAYLQEQYEVVPPQVNHYPGFSST